MISRRPPTPPTKTPSTPANRISTADTAHVVGPGCLRLVGGLPVWRPVDGEGLRLQPKYLKRIIVYGLADISGAAFTLLWRNAIDVVFLNPQGTKILSRVAPSGAPSPLARLQYAASLHQSFCLTQSRQFVQAKIDTTASAARYFQRQGRGRKPANVLKSTKSGEKKLVKSKTIDQVRGIEGAVAAAWWRYFSTLVPKPWRFSRRQAYPARDPVNALLSLGYMLLTAQAQTRLSVANLDTHVGFLHAIRPGRPSLACDIVEPYRIAVVDRLVLHLLGRKRFTLNDFHAGRRRPCELSADALKRFIGEFEKRFRGEGHDDDDSHQSKLQGDIVRLEESIREFGSRSFRGTRSA